MTQWRKRIRNVKAQNRLPTSRLPQSLLEKQHPADRSVLVVWSRTVRGQSIAGEHHLSSLNLREVLTFSYFYRKYFAIIFYSFCFGVLGEWETNQGLRVSRVRAASRATSSTRFSQTCLMFRRWRRVCSAFSMTSTLENCKPLVRSYSTVKKTISVFKVFLLK